MALVVRACAVLVVTGALLGTGCSGDAGAAGPRATAHAGNEEDDPAVPEKGPGSLVFEGVKVARGSVLLGTAFPGPLNEASSRQWRAVVVVRGDPATVFDDYATQLADAPLFLSPGNSLGPCSGRNGDPIGDAGALDDDSSGFPVECSARARHSTMYLWHTSTASAAPWASHIVFDLDSRDLLGERSPMPTDIATIGPPPGLLGDPGPPPPAPRVGERFVAPPLEDPTREPIRVVEGSTILAPAAPSEWLTGGYVAVARITGDPADVVSRYVEQGATEETVERTEYEVQGRRVLRSWWDAAGGPKLYVTATTDEHGDWYALIDVYND